jgi:hypothetical protein
MQNKTCLKKIIKIKTKFTLIKSVILLIVKPKRKEDDFYNLLIKD